MKKIIIHAGLPKTGSTFLQDYIFPRLDKNECTYNPPLVTKLLIELSKEYLSGNDIDSSRISKLKETIDTSIESITTPTLFISIEGLMPIHCGGLGAADKILRAVKYFFPSSELVVFLRDQVNWIRSAYSFCLVSKYIQPFDDFVNKDSTGNFNNRSHDGLNVSVYDYEFEKIRALTRKHFDKTHFFCFEELFVSHENDILERLSTILGVTRLELVTKQSSNKGLNEDLMVLISDIVRKIPFRTRWKPSFLYTSYSGISGLEKLKYFYLRYMGRLGKLVAEILYRLLPKSGKRLFSHDEEERIRSYYRDSNDKFWKSVRSA